MPTMNRVDRLMGMVVQLQSRRVVRAEDLAGHFEISLRTVYRDLAALGEAGIPIVGEAGVGYSLMRGYHLPPLMFTTEEASALFMGAKLVEHLTDASLRTQMESALNKIRSILPRDRQDGLDRLENSTKVMSGVSNSIPRLSSVSLIPIQRALAERRLLTLDYQAGQRRELTHRQVEPLGLVYYADNWHLIGYCRLRQDIRDFRTDRIRGIRVLNELFCGHDSFSLKQYLEKSAREGAVEMAEIRFDAGVIERVRREWSSGLVEEKTVLNGIVATLLVYSFKYFARWLLSFGPEAEVLAPVQLKQWVADEAAAIATRYTLTCRDYSKPVRRSLTGGCT
jgi:predicted DNA-binding transcriptional regulator YafY